MNMLRQMVVLSMLKNIMFSAIHIKCRHKIIALLSRLQVAKAKTWAPWLKEKASPIPKKLELPTNKSYGILEA